MLLLQVVLQECGARCDISTDLDWKTIERRVENEGLEFLTLTLPGFCKGFERSLADRQALPANFRFWKTRGNLPVFLGGFLELIFDRESGRLLEDIHYPEEYDFDDTSIKRYGEGTNARFWLNKDKPVHNIPFTRGDLCLEAVACIRQVTRLYSKIEVEATKSRIDATFEEFLECEKELDGQVSMFVSNGDMHDRFPMTLEGIGRLLYGDIFNDICKDIFEGRFHMPKHGPGATADRLLGNKKFEQSEWPVRLDKEFPAGEYLLPSWRYK
jgi:hypothetical protein